MDARQERVAGQSPVEAVLQLSLHLQEKQLSPSHRHVVFVARNSSSERAAFAVFPFQHIIRKSSMVSKEKFSCSAESEVQCKNVLFQLVKESPVTEYSPNFVISLLQVKKQTRAVMNL